MCGICGIHRFGEKPIDPDIFTMLLVNNINRGMQATGLALQQKDGEVAVYKTDQTAYEFVASAGYKQFLEEHLQDDTVTIIGHTRAATQGSPSDNKNNHPMFYKDTAVVHNGVISNDSRMFTDMKLDRHAETDSDIIRAILDDKGFTRAAIHELSRLSGSAAFAAISPRYPGKLLLGRSGNPIELAGTKDDHMFFSSEKGPLYKALRPYEDVFGIKMRNMTPKEYNMMGMEDHSAWLFGDKPKSGKGREGDWLEWHEELKISYNFQPRIYNSTAEFHGKRVRFYDDRPIDVVQCPNKDCGKFIAVNQIMAKDLKRYHCKACKTPLLPKE